MRQSLLISLSCFCGLIVFPPLTVGQTLEQQLQRESPETVIRDAHRLGDPERGAIVFHQPTMACSRCHQPEDAAAGRALGPFLTQWKQPPSDQHLLEAILYPSRTIRQGFEAVQIVTTDGRVINGLLAESSEEELTLRDPATSQLTTIPVDDIEERQAAAKSIMPAGQVNQLNSRQQFLDLLRYVMDLRDGGIARARELQPPPSMFALKIPEYESHVDHAGLIGDFNDDARERGKAIYNRLCINCHGDHQKPGSLPTALRFAEGRFRNGSDPHAMYRTLTHGFGFMVAQTWMVPQQKYDVIHYIREAYLRSHNPAQYVDITDEYLARLPEGDTRGPESRRMDHWATMDYGPRLINTYETGSDGSNFAYKGIAVRLDPGPGGIAQGSAWMIYDHDTMRMAAAWTADPEQGGDRFIDWNGIHFNGRHGVHPRIIGDVQVATTTGPGWGDPRARSRRAKDRVQGRDGRRYGPLPRAWAQYHGLHAAGDRTIVDYSVGTTHVLEMPGMIPATEHRPVLFTRTFNIGPRDTDLTLVVGTCADKSCRLTANDLQARLSPGDDRTSTSKTFRFDGGVWLETDRNVRLDMTEQDFSIRARIRTTQGGTIFSRTAPDSEWVPNGKALFVRDGRLCYDIGWVGVVQSRRRVDDGEWHDVAMTWDAATGKATLSVDGQRQRSRVLKPEESVSGHVARIGFASRDFPNPSGFQGEISRVRFWQRVLDSEELTGGADDQDLLADWAPGTISDSNVSDASGHGHHVTLHGDSSRPDSAGIQAGLLAPVAGASWSKHGDRLCLTLEAGADPVDVRLWFARHTAGTVIDPSSVEWTDDLHRAVAVNPASWPDRLTTPVLLGNDSGPFTVDHLLPPENNPWLAQTRLTGLDFIDEDSMAVCSWDGDVWIVRGLAGIDQTAALSWQRIANGLFQPLGLKILDGTIFVTCRDQIVVLEDRNGDGETDFYRCFNNDHQVTEHFHEFAMGLQADDDGNLYYAKSARHAKRAVVPHHGTLLKVSADGDRTEILANGFRAANGVCLNPDGTFVVTDQEGHWNPKNRINWVREGGFYGNMFGYHDVTDSSDEAMQPPLCWITNAFDRSPGELLWVSDESWGPLHGTLLNLSYGYGRVYVVPFEDQDGQPQGGMCELPIPQFPTGIMRGRFHPTDGHLYVCGMFAWAGNQQHPGGLYRLKPTGRPSFLPRQLTAHQNGLSIQFTDPLDRSSAEDPEHYRIKVWSLKRTASYGSEHYNERSLVVTAAELDDDGRTVRLTIPDIAPTWCMEIRCQITTADGHTEERVIHNTIHQLGE